jgi:hypothetical protein
MLKLADYDSVRGEHVGTTSGMNVTSGKSGIWPLAAPENQVFRKLQKFPKGKRPRHNCFWTFSIWEEAQHCLVCWHRNEILLSSTLL